MRGSCFSIFWNSHHLHMILKILKQPGAGHSHWTDAMGSSRGGWTEEAVQQEQHTPQL